MVKDTEKKDKKVFLIAQEIELAKLLAGNNKTVRDKALKNLKKWFYNRSRAVRKCTRILLKILTENCKDFLKNRYLC